jgi:uncharacterized protein YtpQ (UPF0354 family)
MSNLINAAFKCWLVAALSLAYSLTATAGDIPKDQAGFTEYVAGLVRAEVTDVPVAIKGPLTLRFGELTANLDRVFFFCQRNAGGCSNEVTTYINSVVQVYRDQNAPPTREAIRLVVRTTQYIQQTQGSLPPGSSLLLPKPLVEGLVLLPVLDSPRSIRMLNEKDLKSLGLSAEEAEHLALVNLRNSLKPLMDVAKVARHGQIGQLVGDSFHPSRLALLDTWAPLAKAQGDQLIVTAPATDAVFYVGEDTAVAIDALRTLARNVMSRAPNPLSNILLRWTPGGWEIVKSTAR